MAPPERRRTWSIDYNRLVPLPRRPLTDRQLAVLGWIADGCPDGVWPDHSHKLSVGALEVRTAATDHGIATRAVCLQHDGATLAYSADSGPGWSVETLGRGIGTFLCEATFTREEEGSALHLSGRQAGTMAAAAGVHRLILTHRSPTVSAEHVRREAELAYGRPVEQASMGAVYAW